LPELLFSFNRFAMMRTSVYGDHGKKTVEEYIALFSEPGALTAALNWYRASALSSAPVGNMMVATPTAFIWGNQDPVVGDLALETQRQYFDGNLTETELETGHWLLETEAQAVTAAVLSHVERHR
jgi:pimeloyl-ACP methyl ester carboxylesterase